MTKILISNDDGISSPGVYAAKKALESLGDVTLVCPESEHSGSGRSFSVFEPLEIKEHKLEDGSIGYGITGTPADSVTTALKEILDEKPDLVISGINKGLNICKGELTSSGTIGAALEGSNNGIPSIAVSVAIDRESIELTEDGPKFNKMPDFTFAGEILLELAKKVLDKGLPEGVDLLNLNIPSEPKNKDIKITKLGKNRFSVSLKTVTNKNGDTDYYLSPKLLNTFEEGTDGYCVVTEKRPSLTPITLDMTGDLEKLKDW